MSYTKGDWKLTDDGYVTAGEKYVHEPNNFGFKIKEGVMGNSRLIAAAVNACASVNPDNPLAVAESIKDMHGILQDLYYQTDCLLPIQVVERMRQALAKAEGR